MTIELTFSLLMLTIPWFADALEHSIPNLAGTAVALIAAPVVFAVDAIGKHRRRTQRSSPTLARGGAEPATGGAHQNR
jgi:hypothetical protein